MASKRTLSAVGLARSSGLAAPAAPAAAPTTRPTPRATPSSPGGTTPTTTRARATTRRSPPAFEAANPGVTDRDHGAAARGHAAPSLTPRSSPTTRPTCSMEWGGGELAAARRGRPGEGHHRRVRRDHRDGRRLRRRLAGRRQDLRAAVLLGVVGLLVQQGASSRRPASPSPPATLDEFYDAVDKLKAAGIEPISVGAGDKWPAAHYWYYFAVRECTAGRAGSRPARTSTSPTRASSGPARTCEAIVATEPFNDGLPRHAGPAGRDQRLRPARHRQGRHGAAGPLGARRHAGSRPRTSKGLGEDTGWFPFPTVDGGEGDPAAALGGGDAWACSAAGAAGVRRTSSAYMLSDEVQQRLRARPAWASRPIAGTAGLGHRPEPRRAGSSSVTTAPYVQLYFDTAFGAERRWRHERRDRPAVRRRGEPRRTSSTPTQAGG